MRVSLFFILLFLVTASTAAAEDRVIGLLTLPAVFGDAPCDQFTPEVIPLYPEPGSQEDIGVIRVDRYWTFPEVGGCMGLLVNVHMEDAESASKLPTREYAYEAPAAVVLEKRDQWFRVRLPEGSAWLEASGEEEYYPLEELLVDRLTYVAHAPDSPLSDQPGAPAAEGRDDPVVSTRDEVRVLESREVDGELWTHIEVMSHSVCHGGERPTVVARGWMPAYAPSGEPAIWFYSRGC